MSIETRRADPLGCEHVVGRNRRCVRCLTELLDRLDGEQALVADLRATLALVQTDLAVTADKLGMRETELQCAHYDISELRDELGAAGLKHAELRATLEEREAAALALGMEQSRLLSRLEETHAAWNRENELRRDAEDALADVDKARQLWHREANALRATLTAAQEALRGIVLTLGDLDLTLGLRVNLAYEGAQAALTASPAAKPEECSDEELTLHTFNSRTPYEPGDDRDIWCKDCEYHRDHQIHRGSSPAATPIQLPDQRSAPEWTCPTCGGDALWCKCASPAADRTEGQ